MQSPDKSINSNEVGLYKPSCRVPFDQFIKDNDVVSVKVQNQDRNQEQVLNYENELYIPFFAKTMIRRILDDPNYICVSSEGECIVFVHKNNKIFQRKILLLNRPNDCFDIHRIGVLVMNKSKTKVLLQNEYGKYTSIVDKSMRQMIASIGLTQSNMESIDLCGGCVIHSYDEKNNVPIRSNDPRLEMIRNDTLHCYAIIADIDPSVDPGDKQMRWFDISVLHQAYDYMIQRYPSKLTSSLTPYTESIVFNNPIVDLSSNIIKIVNETLLISCVTLLWLNNHIKGKQFQSKISKIKNDHRIINIF